MLIAIGLPVMMLGTYMLFIPPEDVGILYFLIWLTVFFWAVMIALPIGPRGLSYPQNIIKGAGSRRLGVLHTGWVACRRLCADDYRGHR